MSKKLVDEKHSKEALKEMLAQRKRDQPVEEVLAIFCERYGLSLSECRSYYDELVKKGEI